MAFLFFELRLLNQNMNMTMAMKITAATETTLAA